ncbi:unnamed protein product [Meganyctiphanes norvegica]|uniref:Uncharacterized protein n=1 Tax=Meganyctiphanes norvegica TaxID=48144 RepID=A0AAV2SIV9_MEGNR
MWLIQILLVTACLQEVLSITCYNCTSDEFFDDDGRPFDPDCGSLQYDGLTAESSHYTYCITVLWESGAVIRGFFHETSGFEDGECRDNDPHWGECFCTHDRCNTGNYCEQCDYIWPPITNITTAAPTTLASTNEPITTTEGSSLICYHCVDCSSIDDSTPVIQDPAFSSCVSTVFLTSTEVVRGGTRELRPDGECEQYNSILSCWCSTDFCNDEIFGQLNKASLDDN